MTTNSYNPLSVWQESRNGSTENPLLLTARWDNQYIGFVMPQLADVEVASMKLLLVASQTDLNPSNIDVAVDITEISAGVPSEWPIIDTGAFVKEAVEYGSLIEIPLDYRTLMSADQWGIVISATTPGPNNLQVSGSPVALVVEYVIPEFPEPENHVYTITRDFNPGDSVLTRVINGDTLIAEMKFIIS